MGRASVVVRSDADRVLLADWAYRVPLGTRVDWRGPRRSTDQNDLMWARLTELSRQLDWHGQKLKAEDWKLLFLDALRREVRMVPNLDGNGFVSLGRSSSDLSKDEMSDLLELIGAFGVQRGVTFQDMEREPA